MRFSRDLQAVALQSRASTSEGDHGAIEYNTDVLVSCRSYREMAQAFGLEHGRSGNLEQCIGDRCYFHA